jgi:2-amino-4-hydroxy-6-hydroxymethyldihydropteridine diphosphokinase
MAAAEQVYLSLGSNMGDREQALELALAGLLRRGFEVTHRSGLYLTEPVQAPPQEWFLNVVVGGRTALPPEELLRKALEVEAELGRVRSVRRGPRPIDVDLLFYGEQVRSTTELTLPHPRLAERLFVLVPLLEIAPRLRHPLLGLTVAEMRARCTDTARVLRHQPARR